MRAPLPTLAVRKALTLLQPPSDTSPTELEFWAGRVGELSQAGYGGALTLTASLAAQVQARGEQTAWLAAEDSIFFPPDLAARGIDLAALTVVRTDADGVLQAADWLLRSGAFGLIVADHPAARVTDAELGRLGRLCEEAGTALVFLTLKSDGEPSLGTQLALRVTVRPCPGGAEAVTLKDKRGVRQRSRWSFNGPMGLY
jgi:recombination protein RecA